MAVSLSTSDNDANMCSDTPEEEEEEVSSPTADYVFRIVFLTDR